MKALFTAALAAAALAWPAGAWAQIEEDDFEIEIPTIIFERSDDIEDADTSDIDLANVVQVAARSVTTVQEAPAIVTVITDEQIHQMHARRLDEIMDRVPGWLRYGNSHSQFPYTLSRGITQAVLLMRDGVSMFEPFVNAASLGRDIPVETIKRIEVVTGPGGVLWGANSFLGVINVVTKDARDVEGVEAGAGYGSGPGSPENYRGYVMAGVPDVGGTGASAFLHTSFETYFSPAYQMPRFQYHSPQPQPNSLTIYGPLGEAAPARSFRFNLNGSLTFGSLKLHGSLPFVEENKSLSFAGALIDEDIPQDDLPECQMNEAGEPIDAPPCIDRGRVSRVNQFQYFERYGVAEWRSRFGENNAFGVAARGYLVEFVRKWDPIQLFPAIPTLLPGGAAFRVDNSTYRAGAAIDGDIEVNSDLRLLYGAEGFREWLPDRSISAREGRGVEATFPGPYDVELLPLPCPSVAEWDPINRVPVNAEKIPGCPLIFAFETDRVVLGAYSSAQLKLGKKLILDGGVRAQAAPDSLSDRPYDPQLLGAAALVYNFLPSWHAKINYTQGFRPPVFLNTATNGEAVVIGGSPDLEPERSQAIQLELNARIKGTRQIREMTFRTDYSYTLLENLILFPEGQYENLGTRALHSAEFLGQLYLKGKHRVEVGYTWLRILSEDLGRLRATPEHWFNIAMITNLTDSLEATTAVRVVSAFEDPNRLVEFRGLDAGDDGVIQPEESSGESISVQPYEVVMDRVPPSGELQVGLRFRPTSRLTFEAAAYNSLNGQSYQPDATHSYSPRLDILPNPYERFRFYSSVAYRY